MGELIQVEAAGKRSHDPVADGKPTLSRTPQNAIPAESAINIQDFAYMSAFTIRGLFISPGHNFFGHHGQEAGINPLHEVEEIECVAGHGVRGDRFFDFKQDYKGQITFFSSEVFADICSLLGASPSSAGVTRRNVITEGADLNTLIGKRFSLQGVEFEGTAQCAPCYWMNHAIAPGAEKALQGRGGLRARILTDGKLRVDR